MEFYEMYIHGRTDGRTDGQTEKAAEKHFLISATAKKERGRGGGEDEGEMGTTCLYAVVDGRFQYGRIRMA
jgi:hypothetical protein